MEATNLSPEEKKQMISSIKKGYQIDALLKPIESIEDKLKKFVDEGSSSSVFLSGTPGSGKTYAVRKAIDQALPKSMWRVFIDCRIFDTDKSVCKEFLRQTGNPATTSILEVLREKGSGVIIFDHFDSLKIIKRQFFLYTIFDSIHTNEISLCSIIITSSVEPLANLEKRVRSRLTPHYVDIPAPTLEWSYEWISNVLCFREPKSDSQKMWNDYVHETFQSNGKGDNQLSFLLSISPSLHTTVTFAQKFVLLENRKNIRKQITDSLSVDRFLLALSQTELILLYMSSFLIDVKSFTEFTFDQLFNEMTEQFKQRNFIRTVRKSQAMLAWEKLTALSFFVPTSKDKTTFTFTLFSEDLESSIPQMPTDMQQWIRTWLNI